MTVMTKKSLALIAVMVLAAVSVTAQRMGQHKGHFTPTQVKTLDD